jgi:Icc-related predicted phosphoesterase
MGLTRIYYTCDVHGSDRCFRKFINIAKHNIYKANVLMLSGDLTGKAIVPIVEGDTPGTYTAYSRQVLGDERVVKTPDELELLKDNLRTVGVYPLVFTIKEYEDLRADPQRLKKLFLEEMLKRLSSWIELAEKELPSKAVKCFLMPGNDDPLESSELISKSNLVVNPEGECILLDDHHEMISLGYSNPTPWKTPRELGEDQLMERIDKMVAEVNNMKNCIFNFHCPPYDSRLDVAPVLDENLRPVATAGSLITAPVGSKAIREAIEKYQPMLGLHGHIHESVGEINIGRTVCVNPGSEYQVGLLRGYLVNIDEKGVRSLLRVEG